MFLAADCASTGDDRTESPVEGTVVSELIAAHDEEGRLRSNLATPHGATSIVRSLLQFLREGWVVLAATFFLGAIIVIDTPAATQKTTDYFYNYYAIGKLVMGGHGHQMYDPSVVGALQRKLVAPLRVPRHVLPTVYPPVVGVAFAPLTLLPYSVGYILWLLINCSLLAWVMWVWEQYMRLRLRGRIVWRTLVLCSLPVVVAVLQGQLSIFLLAALTATYVAARSDPTIWAGVFLGLTLVKPQFTPVLVLVFLLLREWRVLGVFFCTALVLLTLPLLVVGPTGDWDFIHSLSSSTGWGANTVWGAPTGNRGFTGFFQLLVPQPAAGVAALCCDVVTVAAVVVVTLRRRSLDWAFGIGVVAAVLVAPHVLIHDLSLLVVPAAIMVATGVSQRTALALLVTGYIGTLIGFSLVTSVPLQLSTLVISSWTVWFLLYAVRQPSHPAGEHPLPPSPQRSDVPVH